MFRGSSLFQFLKLRLFILRTALHYAASWGDIRTIRVLLNCLGIQVNIRDEHGKTPLYKVRIYTKMESSGDLKINL